MGDTPENLAPSEVNVPGHRPLPNATQRRNRPASSRGMPDAASFGTLAEVPFSDGPRKEKG